MKFQFTLCFHRDYQNEGLFNISLHGTLFVDELLDDDDDEEDEEDPFEFKLLKLGGMTSSPFKIMSLALRIVNLARDLFKTKYL